MDSLYLIGFVRESNKIEGILREPTDEEVWAHANLLRQPQLEIRHIEDLVSVCAPGNRLRDRAGLNVRVGSYIAPPGGPAVRTELEALLEAVNLGRQPRFAWASHVAYEHLHPFTDGNGRSGRAIWLWQMSGKAPLGFLHHFYYQTLEASDARKTKRADG